VENIIPIGTWVYAHSIRKPEYIKHGINDWWLKKRVIEKVDLKKKMWGQICGLCRVCEGMRTNNGEDGVDFKTTKVHTFYEIRFGMLNKPVLAAEDDFIPEGTLVFSETNIIREIRELPMRIANYQEWNERSKAAMRNWMKDWPRDNKGKWIRRQIT